jgi:hypothetical protein
MLQADLEKWIATKIYWLDPETKGVAKKKVLALQAAVLDLQSLNQCVIPTIPTPYPLTSLR